eukprot:CAMPEP_0174267682 /NCGR_PEP_ID=MMETSP0439-20130205/34525_1 /TAXON_ID=0 /ORGANISM="Stereomyxa ramosa, Strain Chinc5" /LENGTH=289 /DNA_ID=CAMNT_0015355315 /DNA_START=13 /DNA_END=879 /DNA_ORIENTATION=-
MHMKKKTPTHKKKKAPNKSPTYADQPKKPMRSSALDRKISYRYCPQCGVALPDAVEGSKKFCLNCGSPLALEASNSSSSSMERLIEETAGSLDIKHSEIEKGPKLGEGAYGVVYKGKCRGFDVAIKVLHNQSLTQKVLDELRNELSIMIKLRNPNIILLMGLCLEKEICIVMEYVEGRDLEDIITSKTFDLTPMQTLRLLQDIAKGIQWLHSLDPPILHRDIKPGNVLVDKHLNIKLIDFGLSCIKEKQPDGEVRKTIFGTPIYMAPEILQGSADTEKSDSYSYAITAW